LTQGITGAVLPIFVQLHFILDKQSPYHPYLGNLQQESDFSLPSLPYSNEVTSLCHFSLPSLPYSNEVTSLCHPYLGNLHQ
jgi:hypothetical protein